MILDGYGLNDNCQHNAVCEGKTPVMDQLMSQCPFVKGEAEGSKKEGWKLSMPIKGKKPKKFIKSWYSTNLRKSITARRKPHEATEKIDQRAKRMLICSLFKL